jgi:hypothetical protein
MPGASGLGDLVWNVLVSLSFPSGTVSLILHASFQRAVSILGYGITTYLHEQPRIQGEVKRETDVIMRVL